MGYDLYPVKKTAGDITVGAFSWPVILEETGAGFILGYGPGRTAGSYIYQTGNNGSPVSNDGYKVSAFEAKAMARCMRGYVSVARAVNKEWETVEDAERLKAIVIDGHRIYKTYCVEERLLQIEKIAEFCEKSGGFKIR